MSDWTILSSSMLAAAKYDAIKSELHIRFKTNGSTYVYSDVPEDDAQDLMSAASPGSFFLNNIKDIYGHRRG